MNRLRAQPKLVLVWTCYSCVWIEDRLGKDKHRDLVLVSMGRSWMPAFVVQRWVDRGQERPGSDHILRHRYEVALLTGVGTSDVRITEQVDVRGDCEWL